MTRRNRRAALGITAAVLLAAGAFGLYQRAYPVDPDWGNLGRCVEERYLHGQPRDTMPPYVLYGGAAATLGDRTWILWEVGENLDLGRVILEESWTGRSRVTGMSWGGGNFLEEVAEADGERYLLFGGRNTGRRIASASFTLDGEPCTVELPREDRFLVYVQAAPDTEAAHMDLGSLRLYDEAGAEVTEQYRSGGDGILDGTKKPADA